MTIDPEMLAAYADGELGAEDAAKVEAAMAADPTLAEEVAAHRKLRETLSAHFAQIAEMPVPERLTAMLTPKDNVVSLAAVRQEREAEKTRRTQPTRWAIGGLIAASLVMGVMIGGSFPSGDPIRSSGGALVASGTLDKALTTQLASAQQGENVRILVSFQRNDGHYCRGFEAGPIAGIACHESNHWTIVRSQSNGVAPSSTDYRQASSGAAQIMAAAQDMAAGGALDEAAEKRAQDAGWLRRP